MIRKMKRPLCFILIAAMAFAAMISPAIADADGQLFTDVPPGKWYYEIINASAGEGGFIEGYGDGTFRPWASVTRAEFVKMLLAATHLTPDSGTAEYLHWISRHDEAPSDLGNHWLTEQGWTQAAVDFGLILPSDCFDGAFLPDRPATRCEAAVMVVRALGLVNPAQQSEAELSFTDAEAIPQELRGYVSQAVEAGVLKGYPDGSFQGDRTITRAEAVAMAVRALEYMEQGVDPDIRVHVKDAWDPGVPQVEVTLSSPAQVIDGAVYVPAWNVMDAYATLCGFFFHWNPRTDQWDPQMQQFGVISFYYGLRTSAGSTEYNLYTDFGYGDKSATFAAPVRMLYGELMIPIYVPSDDHQSPFWEDVQWDGGAKTLLITMYEQYRPSA